MKRTTLRAEVTVSLGDDTIEIAGDAVQDMCVIRHINSTGRITTSVLTELSAKDWTMIYNGTYAEIRSHIIDTLSFDIATNTQLKCENPAMRLSATVVDTSFVVKEVIGPNGISVVSKVIVNPHAHVFADELIDAVNVHRPIGIDDFAKINNHIKSIKAPICLDKPEIMR